ncbi:S49 family peptidase [Stutzerimonas stutzeri]|uniref:S49 family peptidase n=1 Tax=Stutzerimonas stutzeri TaxID=316 RepID=UPI000F7746B7|nr:S49 family peptidase [Stutzerimonas stutzeri]RRV38629.1 S49 family peptidase [Stutzerimonas stutzeri]RRV38692.1 S49 family peptidase [Stutzerimonas stutzeri]
MIKAFELAAERPWLITESALDQLMAIADRMGDPEALETRLGRPLDNSQSAVVRDGVAIIPVTGPIFRYANMFTRISGATSTQVLATDIQAALDNPQVRGIVLNVDSPGGEANGINELSDLIYAARSKKPIKAYVGGMAASGGYWIASAASEVIIDDTGMAGSIGAVVEIKLGDDKESGKRYQIVSRNAPNKRPDLSTEGGRAKIAETIDALGDVFAAKVARNLGVDPEDVPAMGDHGGIKMGAAAVEAGLAHRLGSLESVIADLARPAANQQRKPSMQVKTTAELRAAIEAGTDPLTIEIAEPVMSEPVDVDAIKAEASQAAVTAERERIKGINALAAVGFEEEVSAAIDTGLSVEATALSLYKASQDRGVTLGAIKSDAKSAAAASPKDGTDKPTISAKSIWAQRQGRGA